MCDLMLIYKSAPRVKWPIILLAKTIIKMGHISISSTQKLLQKSQFLIVSNSISTHSFI